MQATSEEERYTEYQVPSLLEPGYQTGGTYGPWMHGPQQPRQASQYVRQERFTMLMHNGLGNHYQQAVLIRGF